MLLNSYNDNTLCRTIFHLRHEFQVEFEELIRATEEQALNLPQFKSSTTIICNNGSFNIQPAAIPIAASLNKSLFVASNTATIELSVSEAKQLFSIYMSRSLPLPELLTNVNLEVYTAVSDYLGIEFYAQFFNRLVQ